MTVVRPHLQWGVAELGRGRCGRGLRREAAQRALDQRRLLRASRRGRWATWTGQRAGAGAAGAPRRATASLPPTGTRDSGTAWTPTRTRSSSNDLWASGGGALVTGAGQRRARVRRLAPGAGAARARGGGAGARPAGAARSPTSAASGSRASTCSASAARSSWSRPTCATPRRSRRPSPASTRSSTSPRRRSSGWRANRRWRPSRSTCRAPGTSSRPAARTGSARIVFASSDKAYGSSPELPYREDFPLRAAYPYDASKAAADTIARSYAHAYGLPLAVTRFANVYGGGDLNFSRLIPETVVAVLDGRAPVIRSDGSPERDFLHVDDAVSAYLAIAAALGDGRGRRGLQRRRRAAALGARGGRG